MHRKELKVMTQAFNLLKREGGKKKQQTGDIWGEMIESRVIILPNYVSFSFRGD